MKIKINMKKRAKAIRAIVLFSGGLDSLLAVKLLQEQDIDVVALHFISPFFPKSVEEQAKQLQVQLIEIDLGNDKEIKDFLSMIRKPRFGYGTAINPCLDCKLLMLKKAKKIMQKLKADFIATGGVLNERPMSQTLEKFGMLELEAGLEGKILRPLSAKLLPETIPEKKKMVDRNKLLAIQGRRRIQQIALAKKHKLKYPEPAGGCLLCERDFAIKMRDLLRNKKDIKRRDLELLKLGRHFRTGSSKIIVGRNELENKRIISLADNDWLFEVKKEPGPTSLLERPTEKTIKIAAALTAAFSDARNEKEVEIIYGRKLNKSIKIKPFNEQEIEKYKLK
jgi:tRNA U34 2-thiouridine synthase MnmA/TrmU